MIHFSTTTPNVYYVDSADCKVHLEKLMSKFTGQSRVYSTPASQRVYDKFDYWFTRICKDPGYTRAFTYVNLNTGHTLILISSISHDDCFEGLH